MANSTRYYQLTPDILLEYVYVDIESDLSGDATDRVIDLQSRNKLYLMDNSNNGQRYLFFRDARNDNKVGVNYGNIVASLNKNDTKLIKIQNETTPSLNYDSVYSNQFKTTEVEFEGSNTGDVYFDRCIIHFTGVDYFGDYESLIFQVSIKDLDGYKINLADIIFKRTDDVELNDKPMLINQRLYTTHMSFRVPSTNFIINQNGKTFVKKISKFGKLEKDTPMIFEIHGVKSSFLNGGFLTLNTVQLNMITVPYYDTYKKVSINIEPAEGGDDYFIISASVNSGGTKSISFSDFIYSMDANPSNFIIMHEIDLYENCVFSNETEPRMLKTHSEYHLVNLSANETDIEIDESIIYRPVCMYANMDVSFTIMDTLRIINTEDNTTTVKKSSRTFGEEYVHKYGKRLGSIFTDNPPIQVNVFNRRRTDEDLDDAGSINGLGGNGGGNSLVIVKPGAGSTPTIIDNHQYDISVLTECTNIGVSIQQMSTNDIEK